jgi:hypothetical protein
MSVRVARGRHFPRSWLLPSRRAVGQLGPDRGQVSAQAGEVQTAQGRTGCKGGPAGLVEGLDGLDEAGWTALAAGTPLRRLDFPRLRRNLVAITAGRRAAGPDRGE